MGCNEWRLPNVLFNWLSTIGHPVTQKGVIVPKCVPDGLEPDLCQGPKKIRDPGFAESKVTQDSGNPGHQNCDLLQDFGNPGPRDFDMQRDPENPGPQNFYCRKTLKTQDLKIWICGETQETQNLKIWMSRDF